MKIQPLNYHSRFSAQNRPSFKSQTEKQTQQNFDTKQKIVLGSLLAGSALLLLSGVLSGRFSKKTTEAVAQALTDEAAQATPKRKLKHAKEKLSAIVEHRASKKPDAEVLQTANTDQPQVNTKRKLKNPSKKLYAIMEHRAAKDNERVIAKEIEEDAKALELFNKQWEDGMDDTVKRFIERTPEEVERLLEIQEDIVNRLYK